MFLNPPETEQSFKANIDELIRCCLNDNKKIVIEHLPECLPVGAAAWLIESVKQGTTDLNETAIKAVIRLHANISKIYYQGISGITKTDMAYDFKGQAYQNFIILKEALVEYIKIQPFYKEVLATSFLLQQSNEQRVCNINITQNIALQLTKNEHLNVDARIYNTEYSHYESEVPTDLPTDYLGDDVNLAVVKIILPKLLPNKKQTLTKKMRNELCTEIFQQLAEILNSRGAKVNDNLPQKNKKDGEIKGSDRSGNPIKLSYEALERRVKSRLILVYQNDLEPEIHNI